MEKMNSNKDVLAAIRKTLTYFEDEFPLIKHPDREEFFVSDHAQGMTVSILRGVEKTLQAKEPDECPRDDKCDLTIAYMCGQADEAKQRRKKPEWLPIESAPREVDIILYVEETGEQFIAQWMTDENRENGAWIFARSPLDRISFQVKNPTHWMPLPAPPKASEVD